MGSNAKPAEQPMHRVDIHKNFAIGRREVTFAEWDRCVERGRLHVQTDRPGLGTRRPPRDQRQLGRRQAIRRVALQVDRKVLSTADGGGMGIYSQRRLDHPLLVGKDIAVGHAQCAECGIGESGQTAPAGSFRPNAFGLYDTAGNAAEWVEDCWNPSYHGAPSDGSAWMSGDCSLRVLRGGSFADKATAVRSSSRFRYDEDVRYYANGFRVARDLD